MKKQINITIEGEENILRVEAIFEFRKNKGISTSMKNMAEQFVNGAIESTAQKPIAFHLPSEEQILAFITKNSFTDEKENNLINNINDNIFNNIDTDNNEDTDVQE